MTSTVVIELLHVFESEGIQVWLDGGWGVDALLEDQTRPHKDIDVIVRLADIPRFCQILAVREFTVRPGGTPSSFVLVSPSGLEIDVHAVTFDRFGNGIYRMANENDWIYPAAGFLGQGSIRGVPVRCLSAEAQVLCHAVGYVPTEKDVSDMEKLRSRFGVELPPHLRRLTSLMTGQPQMTVSPTLKLKEARDAIVSHVNSLSVDQRRPVVLAIDGGSGAGKSILASMVVEVSSAALIRIDDAKVADVIDWRRLRAEALDPLRRRQPAEWHGFDFEHVRPDGTFPLKSEPTRCDPADVIVLEGAYSSRPELVDLIDLSVLVDSPVDVRHQRLAAREKGAFLRSWLARWDEAEEYYLSQIRPRSSFDLVVPN